MEIYFKNKKYIELIIDRLAKQLTQFGFHEQFRPVRKIGKGGFATVYEVKRALDGKTFAVKAFSKATAFSSPSSKATIENEISILKLCNQENLLNLYEVFESHNSLYLVMENYEGGDLVSLIRRRNAIFSEQEIKGFMLDLLKGLRALDEGNIMHRDIKPENIMIRVKGEKKELVIGDFGLASKTDIPKYLLERCGTPGYVAPEIANFKTGDRVTSKCDMFSLGVLFHILLCRTHLFNGSNCDEVYIKNKTLAFDLFSARYDAIDALAMDLLRKMLEKDPTERISASDAMDSKYFWNCNDYNKTNGTPLTVGSPMKDICDEMVDETTTISKRLNFV